MTKMKTMFNKKKQLLSLTAIVSLAAVGSVGVATVSAASNISAEQAKSIALSDAGFDANQVTALKVETDSDNDIPVYEVEFKSNHNEYDYTINATDGSITEKDNDIDDASSNSGNNGTNSNSGSNTKQPARLSSTDAKSIALSDAGLTESGVTALKVEADSDNDIPVYEIEFKQGNTEYDYTVNAVNGTIVEKDIS
ncbi:PepSY domain-containing protein [Streptococcus dentapri]|uniref:PepSY domain-containing protein n=1 Tax=Streptococcus dentapri TaxID=573564 RepID=A0ABV8D136_9STRE